MKEAIKNVITKIKGSFLINRGDTVILGFSGGPDSLCLLDALVRMSEDMNLRIVPVHVNHKLRKAADEEQAHAEEICEGYNLPLISIAIDCREFAKSEKLSIEEAGRMLRYGAFHKVADDIAEKAGDSQGISIALAHNADDQSETVLFRIIRGTGIRGLAGIRPLRMDPDYPVIRPILDITRKEIEAYVKEARLTPNIDESNNATEYTRNKLRLELIPEIENNYNPRFSENLRNLAEIALIDDDCMRSVAIDVMGSNSEIIEEETFMQIILRIDEVLEMHPAIIRRVVQLVFEELGIDELMSYTLVSETIDVMLSSNPSAKMKLPGNISAYRRYGEMIFETRDQSLEIGENDENGFHKLMTSVMTFDEYEKNRGKRHAAFDYKSFEKEHPEGMGKIVIRNRKSGDLIPIKGGKNKKIQDLFVDEKVNKSDREKVELVAIGNEVLWIIPCDYLKSPRAKDKGIFSQKYQVTDTTDEVIFLEII